MNLQCASNIYRLWAIHPQHPFFSVHFEWHEVAISSFQECNILFKVFNHCFYSPFKCTPLSIRFSLLILVITMSTSNPFSHQPIKCVLTTISIASFSHTYFQFQQLPVIKCYFTSPYTIVNIDFIQVIYQA